MTRLALHSPSPEDFDLPPREPGQRWQAARRIGYWGSRLLIVVVLAVVIGYLPLRLFGEKGITHYRRMSRELTTLRLRNDRLAVEIKQMQLEIRRLRSDDLALEKAAREDLGMIRKGELVYVVQ